MTHPGLSPSRRAVMALAGATTSLLLPSAALGQRRGDVPLARLLEKTPLQEMAIGSPDAKVTIVEYASLTCAGCQKFHLNVLPGLKAKYIDTGKARLIVRIWPRDERDGAAYMLVLCSGGEKAYALVTALFRRQAEWAFVEGNASEKLFQIVKQAGFTKQTFETCLADQKLLDDINAEHDRAARDFGIEGTPTFFVNGKRLKASTSVEFEKALDAELKSP